MRGLFRQLLLACTVACAGGTAQASESVSAMVTIRVNNPAPTCRLDLPTEYYLGQLTTGTGAQQRRHPAFTVKWECDHAVRTALKATLIKGKLLAEQDRLEMTIGGAPNGTLLWLEGEDNRAIRLSGSDSDAFCAAIMAERYRECLLTPVTEVHAADRKGRVEAAIRFEVVYLL